MKLSGVIVLSLLLAALVCLAQQKPDRQEKEDDTQGMPGMPGMDMTQMQDTQGMQNMQMKQDNSMNMQPQTFTQEILRHDSSGTSAQPDSTPVPMLMKKKGQWNLMFHANVFALDEQETGARSAAKFFSTNWFMGMAQRHVGSGTFTVHAMLSLEPATITGRQYPLLFQQGETAFGKPIADGQHPHDFIMELSTVPLKVEQTQLDTRIDIQDRSLKLKNPSKIGVFSKIVTLRIWRIW